MKRISGTRASPRRKALALCLAAALGISADGSCGTLPTRTLHATMQPQAPAGTEYVTNCDDSGPGSLREAVASGSNIDLTRLTCDRIELTSNALGLYTNDFTLIGPGADRLTISASQNSRVLNHLGAGQLDIEGITIADGSAGDSGGCIFSHGSVRLKRSVVTGCTANGVEPLGGGVYAANSLDVEESAIVGNTAVGSDRSYGGGGFGRHSVVLYRSTVSDNVATGAFGNTGGVCSVGSAWIAYSTISNNRASYNAGVAVFGEETSPSFTMTDSTVSGNVATLKVAGVGTLAPSLIVNSTIAFNQSPSTDVGTGLFVHGEAQLINTIVADNASAVDLGGYADASVSGSHNVIGSSSVTLPADTIRSDPMLAPLADNGGTTLTHALLPGSPAIDAGTSITPSGIFYDQRMDGFGRTLGSARDIGAYEVQSTGVVRTVSSCADDGAGSLRDTISHATAGDTVDLRGLACSRITLTSGAVRTTLEGLTIIGPGRDALTIDGNDADRVLVRDEGNGTLLLSGLTLSHGYAGTPGDAQGGCLHTYGVLSLDHVTVTDCTARSETEDVYGGAIFTAGLRMRDSLIENSRVIGGQLSGGGGAYAYDATLIDSIVRGNSATVAYHSAQSRGGGLFVGHETSARGSTISANQADIGGAIYGFGDIGMIDSTVSGNAASRYVGGITAHSAISLFNSTVAFNSTSGAYQVAAGLLGFASTRIESSILFGNLVGSSEYDVGANTGGSIEGSHDLVGASRIAMPPDTIFGDPLLGPLQDNGGPTPTHAIGAGSPAIDAGSNMLDLANDQRGSGFVRVFGGTADIGAFETQTSDTIFADGFD
jgi:hypothetical protein